MPENAVHVPTSGARGPNSPAPHAEHAARPFGAARPAARPPHSFDDARRQDPRLRPAIDRLWVQWWDDGEGLGAAAKLVNVSRGGALIVVPRLLLVGQTLRIYLEDADPPVGISGKVAGAVEGKRGSHQVRVVFDAPCPDAFYEAAAYGFESWLARGASR